MASAEIALLSKHVTPTNCITTTSVKMIMILPAFVCLWLTFKKSYKQNLMIFSGKARNYTRTN